MARLMAGRRVSMEFHPMCQYKYIHKWPHIHTQTKRIVVNKYLQNIALLIKKYLTIFDITYIIIITHMNKNIPSSKDSKKQALRKSAALNPHPETVRDEAFVNGDFFDPNDFVQVKYEMLRRHRLAHMPVTQVARAFGISRQAFYSAQSLFERQGIPGLIPKRRGPQHAHKCTDEVLEFVENWKQAHPSDRSRTLAEAIKQRFGYSINPRSIDRALTRRKKKLQPPKEKSL